MIEPYRFGPTRNDGLARLAEFVPHAGRAYTSGRNTDPGPSEPTAVSKLSPYARYRLITEQEIATRVLARHSLSSAEKYVQEVLWRTYWKGWLEMRPSVWSNFVEERDQQRNSFPNARVLASAEAGLTGVDGFDDWAHELVQTGYLHNHARMWFASIWIFTLRLPWALGADFFLRHLIDADTASNTLSWRWVAGLQTVGKTYLATADNIARYTNGRFEPKGLAGTAIPVAETHTAAVRPLANMSPHNASEPALMLVTHEDMYPESLLLGEGDIASAVVAADSDLLWGDAARDFVDSAATDTASRIATQFGCSAGIIGKLDAAALIKAAQSASVKQIVTPYAPVGPVADALHRLFPVLASEGIRLNQVRRGWDDAFWPHAKKGFFPFKEKIPAVLAEFSNPNPRLPNI